MRTLFLLALLLSCSLVSTAAQAPVASTAEQEVRAVVAKLFDSMRARDTAALRTVFDSGARLVTTRTRNGAPEVDVTTINQFIQITATAAAGQLLDERVSNMEVRVSDNLAVVWTEYKFYVGERFSHCGVDSFQLARGANGWKLIALADTQRPAAQCQ